MCNGSPIAALRACQRDIFIGPRGDAHQAGNSNARNTDAASVMVGANPTANFDCGEMRGEREDITPAVAGVAGSSPANKSDNPFK